MSFKKFTTENYAPMGLKFDGDGFYFKGNSASDRISGTRYDDHINGDGSADVLNGYAGNDLLSGGAGNDVLKGGSGADIFSFGDNAGVDRIVDFKSRSGDKIMLNELSLTALEGSSRVKNFGVLEASKFVIGKSAQDSDDHIVYDKASGALFYDADGNGAGVAVQFASLKAGTALSASDFYIV